MRDHMVLHRQFDLFYLFLLLIFEVSCFSTGNNAFASFANVVGGLSIIAIFVNSLIKIMTRDARAVWTPLVWLRFAAIVFLGVGSLATYMSNDYTLDAIHAYGFFSPIEQLKVSIIYSLGIFCTLFFAGIVLRPLSLTSRRSIGWDIHRRKCTHSLSGARSIRLAIIFLSIGAILRYGIYIPVAFGSSSVVAGSLLALANIYYVGIVILTIYSAQHRWKYAYLIFALVGIDLFFSLLTFSKREIISIIMFPAFGILSTRFSFSRILILVALLFTAYSFSQDIVRFGRAELAQSSGFALQGTFSQRLDVLSRYFDGTTHDTNYGSNIDERQHGLMRVSYVNVDVFAVRRYDTGDVGNTYGNALAVFVPRILWPNKPIITNIGVEFYYLLTSQVGSSFGMTLWAEAYWNFGWVGVVFMSVPLGIILAIFSKFSLRVVRESDWFLMPVVLLGILLGTRIDGYFVPDILGKAWIALVLGLILRGSRRLLRGGG